MAVLALNVKMTDPLVVAAGSALTRVDHFGKKTNGFLDVASVRREVATPFGTLLPLIGPVRNK